MTTYTKTTDFLAKDSLPLNNAGKYVKGSEIDTEFNNIATADADNLKVSALGTGIETALGVNTGSAGAPVLFNGAGGTPSSIVLTNASGTAASLTAGTASAVAVGGITGLGTGVATALAVNVGSAGAPVVNGGALGTPASGSLANCTGYPTASQSDMESASSTTAVVTPGRQQYHPSSPKAWVRFSVSGGVCTVDAGYNVASVTYNGVGDYTVNFTTAFSSVNYCVTGCCSRGATDNNALFQQHYATPPAAGSCRVATTVNGGTALEAALVFCSFFGDQS